MVLAQTPTPAPTIEARHFSHAEHKKRGVDTDTAEKCQACHSISAKGEVLAPAAQGHAPCLAAGCHATEFLVVGEKSRKAKPAEFTKASGFCLGCHATVPWPWKKAPTQTLHAWRNQREHHVEMPHFAHTQMKKDGKQVVCRNCHVVNDKFALQVGTPGHAQCAGCHNAKDYPEFTMVKCGLCHEKQPRAEWLKGVLDARGVKIDARKGIEGSRPGSDVRACDSAGKEAFDQKKRRRTPCFLHETPGHRTGADTVGVQCAQCHFALSDKKKWGGREFNHIADLHVYKIIGNATGDDDQHSACSGGTACHRHKDEVNLNSASSNCTLCHANATAKNEPF